MSYGSYCFPRVYLLRMKPTPTIVFLLLMTRVEGANTRRLSCSKARSFIATEGKRFACESVKGSGEGRGIKRGERQVRNGREGKMECGILKAL